jgi:hypothetical protein
MPGVCAAGPGFPFDAENDGTLANMGAAVSELPDGAAEPDPEPLEREKPPPPVAVCPE